ncbi:MAG: DNA-binding NtrC family response regulator [Polyangiales bacterium]|jgi:DNA-binding NtrC family response regulator
MLIRILVVVNDSDLEQRLERLLGPLDAALAMAPTRAILWDRLNAFPADLVVISRAALEEPIQNTIETIRALPGNPETIVVWDQEDAEVRVRLLVAGCTAVVNKNLSDELLRDVFEAFVRRQQRVANDRIQRDLEVSRPTFDDFASSSASMKTFTRIARRVARSDSSVLIEGETGVGKEWLARALHGASERASGPFVPVTLAAVPENLLEAELFGHTKGAFTGAVGARRGCFELAHGGTLLLDEIGDLPRHLQVKLLRVLQERKISRLGSETSVAIDVRVIAATNRRLLDEIAADRFREDLYYRLGVVTLEVPPLRERPEDLTRLLEKFFIDFRMRLKARVTGFSEEALNALQNYTWPGNVRELINVVERSVLLAEGDEITLDDLPRTIVPGRAVLTTPSALLSALSTPAWRKREWKEVRDATLEACERIYYKEQLTLSGGNLKETASAAGVNPKSLYTVMKRHGFVKAAFRKPTSPTSGPSAEAV